jgi:hypothetical protein
LMPSPLTLSRCRESICMNSDFSDLLREFVDGGVRFLLVGTHALAAHAEPRATGDLDVWVANDLTNARLVYKALANFGGPLERVEIADFTSDDLIFHAGA